jgi:lambda repressor-like predicted transcriptional regulator
VVTEPIGDHGRGPDGGDESGLFAAIRHDARVEGLSIRELSDKHRVHRRTVRQALDSAIPPPRQTPVRVAPRLEPFKTAIDDMLREDLVAPRKQRHTARRVLARLVDEDDANGLSYSTVRDYVSRRRPEIWIEAGRQLGEGFVPQTHEPAAEGEVDFADLGSCCVASRRTSRCSRCGCRTRARRCTAPRPAKVRKPSWRATPMRSSSSVGCRSGSDTTT